MGQQLIDQRTADRLLSGFLAPEDAPPGFAELATLLQAARKPPTPQELAGCAATVAAMAEAVDAGAAVPSVLTRRRAGHARLLRPRIAAMLTAGALALSFGGLAEAGVLPAPVQHAAHVVLSKIGLTVPDTGTSGVITPVAPAKPAHPSLLPGLHPTPAPRPGHPGPGHHGNTGPGSHKGHGRRHGHGKRHDHPRPHRRAGDHHRRDTHRHHHADTGARDARGDSPATERGLCNAWHRGRGSEHGKRMSAAAFRRLRAIAADHQESVDDYCAGLTTGRSGDKGGSSGHRRHSDGGLPNAHHSGGNGRHGHGGNSHGHGHGHGNGHGHHHGSPLDAPAPPADAFP